MYKIPVGSDWSFLVGKRLVQLCIGVYNLQLHFDNAISISIDCDGSRSVPFQFTSASAASSAPACTLPELAVPLVSLVGAVVQSAYAENSTTLAISFDNTEVLRILDTSDVYESFSVAGRWGQSWCDPSVQTIQETIQKKIKGRASLFLTRKRGSGEGVSSLCRPNEGECRASSATRSVSPFRDNPRLSDENDHGERSKDQRDRRGKKSSSSYFLSARREGEAVPRGVSRGAK